MARPAVAGMFWSEESEGSARRKLSQNLWRIREALGPVGYGQLVVASGDSLGVNPDLPVAIDVEEFRSGTADQGQPASESSVRRLMAAVELYRGDLLAGFYDDWIGPEQRELHGAYVEALDRLVQGLRATGAKEEALTYARKLTWHEPLREEAHRTIMRLCMVLNRPAEALRQYEQLEQHLFEMGTEPEDETRQLFELIASKRMSQRESPVVPRGKARPGLGPSPFIGRQAERMEAIDVIERTIGGRGSVVLVEGDPGAGKTRFLDEVSRAASWRGLEVLRGSSRPGVTVPFGVVREALAAGMTPLRAEQLIEQVDELWLSEVARVVPQLREWITNLKPAAPLHSGEGRDRVIEAISIVLAAMGRITPHVVVFDDLHWADEDSIDVLRRVAVSPAMRRTSIFVAFRGGEGRSRDEVWRTLRELDRVGATIMTMEPFAIHEVEELVRWAAEEDRTIAAMAPRIHQETGGNPLFVIEATRALLEMGDQIGPDALPLSDDVRKLLAERLERLSHDEREVINGLAIRGGSSSFQQLFQWCEVGRTDLTEALMSLLNRRLVVETNTGYAIAHDQLRRVAYDTTLPEDRVRFHRVIAGTLEVSTVADPAEVAHHLTAAGQSERALGYWLQAARNARDIHAYATAADLYGRARAVLGHDHPPERHIELLAEYESVLAVLGRVEDQRSVLAEWTRLAADDEQWALEAQIRLAGFLALQGDYARAIELAGDVVTRAHRHGFPTHRGRLVAGRARHWSGDVTRALAELRQAAAGAPDDTEVAVALGSVLGETQHYTEAREEFERALRLSRQLDDPRAEAEALGLLALVALETASDREIESMFTKACAQCRMIGFSRGEANNLTNLALYYYETGRIAQALGALEEARAKFTAIGQRRGLAAASLNEAMIRHLVIGDDERAEQLLDEAEEFLRQIRTSGMLAHVEELRGSIAFARGRRAAAMDHLARAIEMAHDASSGRREGLALATRARFHLELGDASAALVDVAAARACQIPDLESRLDLYEAVAVAHTDPDRAWGLATRVWQASKGPTWRSWEIPYLVGLVALATDRETEGAQAFTHAHEVLDLALRGLDPEVRRRALEGVPMHTDIERQWLEGQPLRRQVRLAGMDAPTGRPLRPDEFVEVEWVLDRTLLRDGPEGRRRGLLRLVEQAREQGASPTVDDLAAALEVSKATIKRDLEALRRRGLAPATRGARTTG